MLGNTASVRGASSSALSEPVVTPTLAPAPPAAAGDIFIQVAPPFGDEQASACLALADGPAVAAAVASAAATRGLELVELSPQGASLETLFLKLDREVPA